MVTRRDVAAYIIYASSVLLLPFGITAIIFGILIITGNTSLQPDLKDNIACGSVLIIGGVAVLGGLTLATLGAVKESSTVLRIHQLPLFFIAAAISMVFFGFCRSMRPEYVKERLQTAMDKYASNKEFWKYFQTKYECCGIDNYGDWSSMGLSLPESCCQKNPSTGSPDASDACKSLWNDLSYLHINGCHKELVDSQDRFYYATRDVTIAFVVCQVIALIAVNWMIYDIKKKITWI